MKKSLSIALILVYLSALAYPVAVFAGESQGQPDEIIQENPDYLPNKQDAQFAERSQVGEKWTFKKIPHDFAFSYKEAFWGWGALGFAAGAGLSAGLYPLDDNVKNALGPNEIFGSTGNTVIGWALSPYTYAGVSIIVWGVGAGTKHPKLALTGRALTEAIGFAMVMTAAGKFAFRRTRPDGGSLSFPSAHATAAFAASGVLTVFYGWKGGLASYPLAFLVSLSRLDEQKHWLSDVVMGATIGTVIGIGTAKLLKKENPNLFIFPEVRRDEVSSMSFTDFEIKRELERKSLHIPGLMVPYIYQYAPYLTLMVLGLVSLLYYISEVRRINKGGPLPVIGYLTNKLTRSTHLDLAPIYLAVGLGIAAIALPFKAAMAGALLVCICDAVAAVVGMKFGKRRIFVIRKTYLGTLAFFVAAVLVLWPLLGWHGALITGAVSTVIEALAIEGIDNLFLPILGGVLAKQFLGS